MPRGDGTGPMGIGPRTGRGAGYCTGFGRPGCANGGLGQGRGFRRVNDITGNPEWGRWRMYSYTYPEYTKDSELSAAEEKIVLKNQAELLEKHLNQIRKRMENLDENASKS